MRDFTVPVLSMLVDSMQKEIEVEMRHAAGCGHIPPALRG